MHVHVEMFCTSYWLILFKTSKSKLLLFRALLTGTVRNVWRSRRTPGAPDWSCHKYLWPTPMFKPGNVLDKSDRKPGFFISTKASCVHSLVMSSWPCINSMLDNVWQCLTALSPGCHQVRVTRISYERKRPFGFKSLATWHSAWLGMTRHDMVCKSPDPSSEYTWNKSETNGNFMKLLCVSSPRQRPHPNLRSTSRYRYQRLCWSLHP